MLSNPKHLTKVVQSSLESSQVIAIIRDVLVLSIGLQYVAREIAIM